MAASSTSFTKGNKVHLQSKVKRIPPPPIATRDELMRALTKRIRNGTFKHQVYLMAVKLLSDMQDKAYDERREEKLLQAMSSEELQAILVESRTLFVQETPALVESTEPDKEETAAQ